MNFHTDNRSGVAGPDSNAAPAQIRRIGQLDILRAAAVAMVLGRHLPEIPKDVPRAIWMPLAVWRRTGWAGVDLFFVLSGFLIGGLLFRELAATGGIRIGRFLARRGLKIYPAFYVMIACVAVVKLFTGIPMPTKAVLAECLFVQNYFIGLCGQTWSLAVEEHFYIVLPLVLLVMIRAGKVQRFVPMAIVAIGSIIVIRVAQVCLKGPSARPFGTHIRIDALLCGVVLAYWSTFHRECFAKVGRQYRTILAACGLAAMFAVSSCNIEHWYVQSGGFTVLYVGCAAVLMAALHTDIPTRGVGRVLVRAVAHLGTYSYSIYLWHLFMPLVYEAGLSKYFGHELTFWPFLGVYLVCAIAMGIIMARLIEFPVLAARDRVWPAWGRRRLLKTGVARVEEFRAPELRGLALDREMMVGEQLQRVRT